VDQSMIRNVSGFCSRGFEVGVKWRKKVFLYFALFLLTKIHGKPIMLYS